MKVIQEINQSKLVDFEFPVDTRLFRAIKELDYVELATDLHAGSYPEKASYLLLHFDDSDFEKLKSWFENWKKENL